ncbi:YhcN/YlaJ family sporulation lipoprotein [Halalkalibacter flavus]|uniref:YhcN/YlaJ family sporulation lipoprotein n=1 Tax=Halalkalibacter flavus TaxID=3090668 RepID=UPI002FC9B17A
MKKIAMSVATATMLLGGLAGCGVDNQATDMGANQQTGIYAQDMRGRGAIDGRHRGEGPITDMMTPDRQRGGTVGQGTTRGADVGHRGGLFGGQGTGQTDARGGIFGGQRAGQTGTRGGLFGGQGTGQTNARGGLFGGQGTGMTGQSRTHLNNFQTRGTGNDRGVGYTNTGRDNFGTNTGLFGTHGAQGITGRQGTDARGIGLAGLNRGTARDGIRATERNAGMGRAGLTGGNRPGMVDEDGILRGRARRGAGALDATPGHRRQGQGAMNLEARDRGNVNHGTRTPNRFDATGRGDRTGVHHGQQRAQGKHGTRAMNYHKDYDGQTVQRLAERCERIDGVEDARVIVHENDVVVGITTNGDMDDVKRKVEKTVNGLAKDKDVRVVTDSDAVGRIRNMDDRLRTGTAFDEVTATFTDMLGDLGRAVQRPFERSR